MNVNLINTELLYPTHARCHNLLKDASIFTLINRLSVVYLPGPSNGKISAVALRAWQ